MLRRLLVTALLLFLTTRAHALEYTDVYYDPSESGWGVFVVQSGTFQFLAFFIYDAQGMPTWYTAHLSDDGSGTYAGPLYATAGTYFAAPWTVVNATVVGTASFQPIDLYHATLSYSLTGGPTVTKPVQRQTLTAYQMAGNYSGSMSGAITGCNDPSANEPAFRGRYGLAASQSGDDSATLIFTFVDAAHTGIVCTVTGPLTHLGRLYRMAGTMTCTGPGQNGFPLPVAVESLHPTGQGMEGRLSATFTGCNASLHFAAVLNVNN